MKRKTLGDKKLRRKSLKLKKPKRRNSLKLKKSKRRNTLKRRNSLKLKLKKSKRRNTLKRRKMRGGKSLKRRKMRGGEYRTKEFWGDESNEHVFDLLQNTATTFSENQEKNEVTDRTYAGKSLRFKSRFMYGNPQAKIDAADRQVKEATEGLTKADEMKAAEEEKLRVAQEVLNKYTEEIGRGYYLETSMVDAPDMSTKAGSSGVLYLFIIDIPNVYKRYVMSFGFGDLREKGWVSDAFPPTWPTEKDWTDTNNIPKTEPRKRMVMLKDSFTASFQDYNSVVRYLNVIKSDEKWKKRIGIYEMNTRTEEAAEARARPQVQALDEVHTQARVRPQALDQFHSSHAGLRDQAPPYLIERILKDYKEERKYIELSLRLLHLSGEKLRGTQIIQKMQTSARENLDWGKKPWMFTSAQIKYIWGLIMFGYGLYSAITMDNDTQYADNIGELREIYTLTGMIPETVESLLSFDKVREYYKDKPPFKPIILNYIVEEPITGGPGKDASLISYMKETAKLYDLKELSVYRYNQTTSASFLEMMKSYENDSVLPLRYSYVNIHNKNNGPLYIFILNPLLGKSEEITTEYYESVVFQLICILEPSEEKHFMFPMNTNLLFWCSDIDKKKEKEEVDEDEGASDIARTPGVLPPDASLSQSYTLPTYYGAPQQSESGSPQKPWGKDDFVDPPSKSFIEKVKEFFSDYKTDPKLIPPINENFYSNKQGGEIYMRSVNYQGFNSEGWRSETFKSCKIEEINATVNVSR